MSKIAPGGDNISDASQQTAQRMVEESKKHRSEEDKQKDADSTGVAKLALAESNIHFRETKADYEKRVRADRDLRNILQGEE